MTLFCWEDAFNSGRMCPTWSECAQVLGEVLLLLIGLLTPGVLEPFPLGQLNLRRLLDGSVSPNPAGDWTTEMGVSFTVATVRLVVS